MSHVMIIKIVNNHYDIIDKKEIIDVNLQNNPLI